MSVSNVFKRKDRKSYYCKVNGKFVKLDANCAKALEMWRQLVAEYDTSGLTVPTVKQLLKSYFNGLKVNRAETTCNRREPILKKFSKEYGTLKASAMRPHYVTSTDQIRSALDSTNRQVAECVAEQTA